MEFSRGRGFNCSPDFQLFSVILVYLESWDLFDTIRASVGTVINKSGVKMTQNAPEQMFLLGTYCSCLLLLLLLFYYTLTLHMGQHLFLTVIHCFGKDHYLKLIIIIIILVFLTSASPTKSFFHHRHRILIQYKIQIFKKIWSSSVSSSVPLWMQLMKPQWGVALISFTLKIFFIFWSSGRNCIDHQFTLKTGTKILPPIPAIEGSVKQDLSLFVQISILYFLWFLL